MQPQRIVTPGRKVPAIRRIVLEGTTESLPEGMSLGLTLVLPTHARLVGLAAVIHLEPPSWEWVIEMAHPPLALLMVIATSRPREHLFDRELLAPEAMVDPHEPRLITIDNAPYDASSVRRSARRTSSTSRACSRSNRRDFRGASADLDPSDLPLDSKSGTCLQSGDSGGPVYTVRPDAGIAAKGVLSAMWLTSVCQVYFTDMNLLWEGLPGGLQTE